MIPLSADKIGRASQPKTAEDQAWIRDEFTPKTGISHQEFENLNQWIGG
jgi:hypothetical protein